MPNGPLRITGLPFDVAQYESDKKIEDEEILVSLNYSIRGQRFSLTLISVFCFFLSVSLIIL